MPDIDIDVERRKMALRNMADAMRVDGPTLHLDLCYPRSEGAIRELQLGLTDVRAADSLLIRYDFDRDGWSISQASRFSWEMGEEQDPDWQEVAFVQAWDRKLPGPGDDEYVWKNSDLSNFSGYTDAQGG